MRVHNALDLAEYLLVKQDLMTPKEMKKILDEKKEKWVNFKEHIPVHIDYNSIGVTPEGHVIFLIDIYEYDKEYFEGNVPLSRSQQRLEKILKPPLELDVRIGPDGEVVLTELPRELVELVRELDPDHPIACSLPLLRPPALKNRGEPLRISRSSRDSVRKRVSHSANLPHLCAPLAPQGQLRSIVHEIRKEYSAEVQRGFRGRVKPVPTGERILLKPSFDHPPVPAVPSSDTRIRLTSTPSKCNWSSEIRFSR